MIIKTKCMYSGFVKAAALSIFLILFIFSFSTNSYGQELDVEGDGGITLALRHSGTGSLWQGFYPVNGTVHQGFLQSRVNGDFEVGSTSGNLKFYANGYHLDLTPDGDLGLGTNSPDASLHIDKGTGEQIRLDGSNTWMSWYDGSTYKGFIQHTGDNMYISNQLAGFIQLRTSGTGRLHLTSGGDIGIGTTVPTSKMEISHNSGLQDAHLELYESADDFARLKFKSNPAGTANDGKFWDVAGRTGTATQDAFNLYYYDGSTGNNFFSISPDDNNIRIDGDIVPLNPSTTLYDLGNDPGEAWDDVVGDDFINVSDKRLKKNIVPVKSVLSLMMTMNPVNYKYTDDHNPDGRNRTGFLAQEVQEIFPSVVIDEYVDRDPNTGELVVEKSDILAMNYIELIPITIKAIQEQQEMIDAKDIEIEALKSLVDQLIIRIEALEK